MTKDNPIGNDTIDVLADMTICPLLKGGASHQHILKVLFILNKFFGTETTISDMETEILGWHEHFLWEGEYKNRRNYQQEIETFIEQEKGSVTLIDLYNHLNLKSKDEKDACRKAVSRLVEKAILEKSDGGKTGSYRIIRKDIQKTQFIKKADREGRKFPIHLPLGLDDMCNIHPKSIIIIAGSKSAGKTAFMLNIALMNQKSHEIDYLNSDMGDEEFSDRVTNMGCTCEEDIFFNVYNRASDFQDLITPERKIFIIDFLEIHDEFWKVGAQIKQIWDRLQNGVAIIGIQMKQGSTLGRGGDFTKEKARLYLSLDYVDTMKCTKIRIEEAKSPTQAFTEGIRGWWRHVRIIKGGSEFQCLNKWSGYEEDNGKRTNALSGAF